MKEKTEALIVTFFTTADAMAFEVACHRNDIGGKLISAPRQLSADCGIAWQAQLTERQKIEMMIAKDALVIDALHEIVR